MRNSFEIKVAEILDKCIEDKSFAVALRILSQIKRTFPRYEEYRAKVFEARKEQEKNDSEKNPGHQGRR